MNSAPSTKAVDWLKNVFAAVDLYCSKALLKMYSILNITFSGDVVITK